MPKPTKADVTNWIRSASFVAAYDHDPEHIVDQHVEVGEAGGRWFVRINNDDDHDLAPLVSYATKEAADIAAAGLADELDDAPGHKNAKAFIKHLLGE